MNGHLVALTRGICCGLSVATFFSPLLLQAQAGPAVHAETVQELKARLTAAQMSEFDAAGKAFNALRFADATTAFRSLLRDYPGDAVLSKFAAEAALQMGDAPAAVVQLKPVVTAMPEDWQAVALLTRAYAETGDGADRDAGMAHMLALHEQHALPAAMQQYVLERLKAGENTLLIRTSVEPWGGYKVYDFGQVFDDKNNIFLRITLESGDADQVGFAQEHPKEAAAGMRGFSLDAYQETGVNSAGQRTQTHYTYQFFIGQPSYDTVRAAFLQIAMGKAVPMSSRTNLVAP